MPWDLTWGGHSLEGGASLEVRLSLHPHSGKWWHLSVQTCHASGQ